LVERDNRTVEARGSIPLTSTAPFLGVSGSVLKPGLSRGNRSQST
jgi:hypothetical protein